MPYKDPEKQKEAQRRYEEKRRGKRHRGWVGVLYPDSSPADWADRLTNEGVPACVSPLHDRDVNADGTPKKPHRHVLMVWDGPVGYEVAKPVMDAIGAVMPPKNPKPGQVKPWAVSVRGSARYLCHTDNPEKAQYSPDEVRSFNGADYFELANCVGDDDAVFDEITDFIDEHGVTSFATFIRYCKQERPDWKRYAYHKGAALITRYIKSVCWETQNDLEERRRDLECWASELEERAREKAELEAGNWATNAVVEAMKERVNESRGPVCDWCGRPATGGSVGPEGAIHWCDVHQHLGHSLSEQMSDNV